MAILDIQNVKIAGVSACVPQTVYDNMDYTLLSVEERLKYIETTGVRYRHCVDEKTCTSDLCIKAAEELISKLGWRKDEIDALILCSQTFDYRMPTTACTIQHRLGLSNDCLAFDIALGCTGFVYGLSVLSSLISASKIKKGLLLVGNTQSRNVNYKDKSTYLLFGDSGTATAVEYSKTDADVLHFNLQTYGEGMNSIIIPDGAYRNPVTSDSFKESMDSEGNVRTPMQLKMDGMDVFSFVIGKVPKCLKNLISYFGISDSDVDYYLLHHANKFLCEKLRNKMKFLAEKVPYNIHDFGNSSGACIPLLMVTNLRNELQSQKLRLLFTGFGVGLSVGAGYMTCSRIVVPELIYY